MTIISNLALIERLRQSGLLSTKQLAELPPQGRLADARVLARLLLRRGWLTVYQMNQLLAGQAEDLVLGPYHVLDRLGQGGQSTVYKARHSQDGFLVALKVIRSDLLGNQEAARHFLLEMEAMAKLDHPNVVQFLDADQVGQTYYCAMEYVEGTDLGKYVRLAGPLPAAEAAGYVRQAALGLQHAHEKSLIHRDIKPGNLYLVSGAEPGRCIKILDWGLAGLRLPRQFQDNAPAPAETQVMVGTADYLAPEQALNPGGVDIRGDIYSLGCTFYYLLVGQPPFPGGTLMQKVLRHQNEGPKPLRSLRPDLPAGLPEVVQRMLAKRPDDRFQTPAAVAIALATLARGADGPAQGVLARPRAHPGQPLDNTPPHGALNSEQSTSRGSAVART